MEKEKAIDISTVSEEKKVPHKKDGGKHCHVESS